MGNATPFTAPVVRQPASLVLINGTQVPALEWTVTNNGFFRADTFSVQLAMSALPSGLQAADLSNMDQITAEVRFSTDGSAPTSLIIGVVSPFEIDWRTRIITLTGRDHTQDFIEAKTALPYKNQTSSQVIQKLAAEHGLTANAQATSTLIGKYYATDHDKLTDEVTEWDLITYLAQHEGFYAWVSGTTLNFQPASLVQGTPIALQWNPALGAAVANGAFVEMKTSRNLTLAPDVRVVVNSWNHKQKQAFKATVTAQKPLKSQSKGGPAQVYTFRAPGLTHDQAQRIAEQKAEQITRHERLLDLTMPADVTTTPRNQIQLSGTGTSWDQLYWIDEVTRSMSFEEVSMTVKGKNHSPQSTVSA